VLKRIWAVGSLAFVAEAMKACLELPCQLESGDASWAARRLHERPDPPALLMVEDAPGGLRLLVKARLSRELRAVPALLWSGDVAQVNLPSTLDLNPLKVLARPIDAKAVAAALDAWPRPDGYSEHL
jgi:hypothetical protein